MHIFTQIFHRAVFLFSGKAISFQDYRKMHRFAADIKVTDGRECQCGTRGAVGRVCQAAKETIVNQWWVNRAGSSDLTFMGIE